jgi:hypothetical protein
MKRFGTLMACVVGALMALPPAPAQASWTGTNCNGTHVDDHYVKRSEAQSYSAAADMEGYEWGGGCWNNNNRDDTPGAPDSSGEGADCSGLTFKTWEMENAMGKSGWEYWERLYNVHGPYSTYDFHAPVGSDPFYKLPDKKVSTTIYMDAFGKDGHIAILYVDQGSPFGTDLMIEALGDVYGMGKFYEGYRDQSEYIGVRREGWTDDCWPNCLHASPALVVVP